MHVYTYLYTLYIVICFYYLYTYILYIIVRQRVRKVVRKLAGFYKSCWALMILRHFIGSSMQKPTVRVPKTLTELQT